MAIYPFRLLYLWHESHADIKLELSTGVMKGIEHMPFKGN